MHRPTERRRAARPVTIALLGAALLAAPAISAPNAAAADVGAITEWVSTDSGVGGGRELPSMSSDGRYVVFAGRGSTAQGIWLRDRRTGTTTRLTTGSHFNPAISGDGHLVVYVAYGAERSVKLLDRDANTTETISVDSNEQSGGGLSDYPTITEHGRYVAFQSTGALDDTEPCAEGGGPNKVYVRDRKRGTTTMVSVSAEGCAVNGNAIKPDISADGRFIAFASDAAVLVPVTSPEGGDTRAEEEETSVQHVFVRDTVEATTTLVSQSSAGTPGDGGSALTFGPSVSDDGNRVAFESEATNLVDNDTNGDVDAFVRDLAAGTTIRASRQVGGGQYDLEPYTESPCPWVEGEYEITTPVVGGGPVISGDGLVVAFQSEAPLGSDDLNEVDGVRIKDIYEFNVASRTVQRVSVAEADGTEATGCRQSGDMPVGNLVPVTNGADATIGSDGRYIAFVGNGDLSGERNVEIVSIAAEEEEEEDSTEAAVFLRRRDLPRITSLSRTRLVRGTTQPVTIRGTGFTRPANPEDLTVKFFRDVTVKSATWVGPKRIDVVVTTSRWAEIGTRNVRVTNAAGDSVLCSACVQVVAGG